MARHPIRVIILFKWAKMNLTDHSHQHFHSAPRPVIALGVDYPDGEIIPPHHHKHDQLLYGLTGVVMATTPHGAWMMPPQRGMWIPAGTVHEVRTLGEVKMRSLYLDPAITQGMPTSCQVVGISSFMRNLLEEASALPVEYDEDGRGGALMNLIRFELELLPPIPLSLPLPAHKGLARQCHHFLREPEANITIDHWCDALAMSRRTFTRLFRRETGLSFVAWRQQACIMAALPRLAQGDAVTTIALDLGYDNPAAFSAMFKRILGTTPSLYRP